MGQVVEDKYAVWMKEATHRAANLEQIAVSLQRLIDRGRLRADGSTETIRRASAMAKTYRSTAHAGHLQPMSVRAGPEEYRKWPGRNI